MSDIMTARIPETLENEGGTVLSATVLKNRTDPEQMAVKFVIASDSPDKAFAFARDSALIDEGLRIVRREGLASPGVSSSAIPVACNEKGEPLANPMGTVDPQEKQRYFYSVTYSYLGED